MATQETQQTISGQDSCFLLISWAVCNLMVPSVEVNASKTVSINQTVQQIINRGQWVLIRPGLLVQSPIINAHP